MFQIRDSVFIAITFNGIEYPLEETGFRSITILSGARQFLPTCTLSLADNAYFFTNRVPMTDGVEIEIQVGDGSDKANKVYKFRVFRFKSQQSNGINSYTIIGYYNAPNYMFQSTAKGIRGTSNAALKEVASRVGLEYQGGNTNDMQTWLPGNSRYAVFAQQIAKHGYRDDRSFMYLAVTSQGKMIYRNLSELDTNADVPMFVHSDPTPGKNGEPVYQVVDYKLLNNSGFLNASGGYAQQVVTQSVVGASKISNSLDVKRLTENLMINDDIHADLNRSRVDVRPVDSGNVHASYERAAYQNFRNSLVYAFGVEVMIQTQTDIELLDLVNYTAQVQGNMETTESEAYSGAYVVTGKTTHIVQGMYYEKFQLATTGTNKQVTSGGDN